MKTYEMFIGHKSIRAKLWKPEFDHLLESTKRLEMISQYYKFDGALIRIKEGESMPVKIQNKKQLRIDIQNFYNSVRPKLTSSTFVEVANRADEIFYKHLPELKADTSFNVDDLEEREPMEPLYFDELDIPVDLEPSTLETLKERAYAMAREVKNRAVFVLESNGLYNIGLEKSGNVVSMYLCS
jgi:hypothetical protein